MYSTTAVSFLTNSFSLKMVPIDNTQTASDPLLMNTLQMYWFLKIMSLQCDIISNKKFS